MQGLPICVGTAGWMLPKQHAHRFAAEGTHLERCATGLNCVEINSSFHRTHQTKTYARWAASTPAEFRFAVKVPKTVTHEAKLLRTGALLQGFLEQCAGLGEKLGPLLIQLPPKLEFHEGVAHEFFTTLRELHPPHEDDKTDTEKSRGAAVLEPRHASWFTPGVNRLLRSFGVARVAADPPKGSPLAAEPAGFPGLRYWRFHGAPRTYYSEYPEDLLRAFADRINAIRRTHRADRTPPAQDWIIFDNTALGHAAGNALRLTELLRE